MQSDDERLLIQISQIVFTFRCKVNNAFVIEIYIYMFVCVKIYNLNRANQH